MSEPRSEPSASPADKPFFVVRGNEPLPAAHVRPILAIGNFDGVHRGHQAVIRAALDMAARHGAPAVALTFEPHPRAFFQPNVPLFRLTPEAQKLACLATTGLSGAVVLPFDAALAGVSPDVFVDEILVGRLAARGVVVGFDFHFGKARAGTPEFLETAGRKHGFDVKVVEPTRDAGDPISSSAIRASLAQGQVGHAAHMLGRPFTVKAVVAHGDKRGRELGYPTANLRLPQEISLAFGVYAVRAITASGIYDGVASYGRRPTFDNGAPLLEVHLFNFSGDLYGQEIGVEFHAFLRPELKFDGIEALIRQMDADSRAARAILRAGRE